MICIAVGKEEQPLPYLLYLQGGPGFEAPRPTEPSGWIRKACEEFRVILMDQAWLYRHIFLQAFVNMYFLICYSPAYRLLLAARNRFINSFDSFIYVATEV